jgi:hypothetical protein
VAIISQTIGAAAISFGLGLIFMPAGLISAGIFAVVFGIAMERSK